VDGEDLLYSIALLMTLLLACLYLRFNIFKTCSQYTYLYVYLTFIFMCLKQFFGPAINFDEKVIFRVEFPLEVTILLFYTSCTQFQPLLI